MRGLTLGLTALFLASLGGARTVAQETGPAATESPSDVPVATQPSHESGKITAPVLLKRVAPEVPSDVRRATIDAKVILRATINEQGNIENEIEVLKGPILAPSFTEAAVRAVRQWRYKPAIEGGKPVRVAFTVILDYSVDLGMSAPLAEPFKKRVTLELENVRLLDALRSIEKEGGTRIVAGDDLPDVVVSGKWRKRTIEKVFLDLGEPSVPT